jgi:aminopeptidase-like protein
MMNLISYCDGQHSLLEIAELIKEPFWDLLPMVKTLQENELVGYINV